MQRALIAIAGAFGFNGALYGAWAARIPAIKELHGLSHSMLGIMILLAAFGAILAFPIAGRFSDKLGAVRVVRWAALAALPVLVVMALAPNAWVLGATLFVLGATLGGMDVAMNTWATEYEARTDTTRMSFFHAIWSVGTALGAGFGALAIYWGWSVAFHFISYGAVVAIIGMMLMQVEWESSLHETTKQSVVAIPKGALLLVGFAIFASSVGEGAMADWAALLLIEQNVDEARAVTGFFVFSVMMVFIRLVGDRLTERFGPVSLMRFSGIAGALGVLLAVYGGSFYASLLGFCIMALGIAMVFPISMSRAAKEPGVSPGTAIASVATFGYGGALLGPPIIGFVAEGTSISTAFVMIAGMMLVMSVFAGSYSPPKS